MLKILQARLQSYMNWELPDVQAGFTKGEPEIKLLTSFGSSKRQESSRRTPTSVSVFKIKLWSIIYASGYIAIRDQIANIHWITEKARELQKNIYFCFSDYAKAFNCVAQNKLWKILKEMGVPDHLTCLLQNLYAGQQTTVRTGHATIGWLHIEKGVCWGYILSPCLFNLYAEYIMRNARLDESQAGIKMTGRNINSLRYADDTR